MLIQILALLLVVVSSVPYHSNTSLYLDKKVQASMMKQLEEKVAKLTKANNWIQETTCDKQHHIPVVRTSKASATKKALIVCGIHARQLITVDICIEFLALFAKDASLSDHVNLDMILVANEQRWNVLDGALCQRTDSAGVDLNRNYDVDWNKGSADPDSQSYRGPFAMSQPLSKNVDCLLKANNYTMVLDVHTGEYSLFQDTDKDSINYRHIKRMLEEIKREYCKPCRVATISDTPDPSGHLVSYAARQYNVKYSLLFEVYGGYINTHLVGGKNEKCFKIFNPNFKKFTDYIVNMWVKILEFTFRKII